MPENPGPRLGQRPEDRPEDERPLHAADLRVQAGQVVQAGELAAEWGAFQQIRWPRIDMPEPQPAQVFDRVVARIEPAEPAEPAPLPPMREPPGLREPPRQRRVNGPHFVKSVEKNGMRSCSTCGDVRALNTFTKTVDGLYLCSRCREGLGSCGFCGWACPIEKFKGKTYVHHYCEECGPPDQMLHIKQEPDPTPTTSIIRARKDRIWTTTSG